MCVLIFKLLLVLTDAIFFMKTVAAQNQGFYMCNALNENKFVNMAKPFEYDFCAVMLRLTKLSYHLK